MKIIGAGLAGLLAGNMLRHRNPTVIEAQKSLPNNHSAVLRFRSSVVSDALSIPFKKVQMIKDHVRGDNLVADALNYSFKNTGIRRSDRSITAGAIIADRYIAPANLIPLMADRVDKLILDKQHFFAIPEKGHWHPVISTLPMPQLMSYLNYPRKDEVQFTSSPGSVIKLLLAHCDAYVSLLFPDPRLPFSRVSITGNELTIELPGPADHEQSLNNIVQRAAYFFGLSAMELGHQRPSYHKQKYAKINPIDDDARRDFIFWATDTHGVFSLGRFATWRPGLLLDDLVNDIKLIDKWLDKKDRFSIARAR